MNVSYDGKATHLEWEHENITPKMVDWFWNNMEKCFLLWHPSQHEPLVWAKAPENNRFIGAIHIAPQTWNDGTRQNLYIRFENLKDVPTWVKEYIVYDHCVVVAGIGLGEEALRNPKVMGYRIHQWEKTDFGIKGKSSAIGILKTEDEAAGKVWAAHCAEEIGNWQHFLPSMYQLYKVVENKAYNPYNDLSVSGSGENLSYKHEI
ncbi:MAG: hypothetical protein LCH34_10465 [Firmicutes bacterium]|nr:hypothetical protein [Bacillota bacterium]